MKTVRLFGDLERYKAEWRLDVKTPAEALRAIDVQRDGFLAECDAGNYVAILVDPISQENCRPISTDTANGPWANEELWILPVIQGEVFAPVIWAAVVSAATSLGAGAGLAVFLGEMAVAIVNIGISMAFSAVATLMTSKKRNTSAPMQERPDNKPSFIADGVVNLTAAGHPHPILVGDVPDVGCIVLSSDYWVEDLPL
ncbi:hypothetical protein PL263_10305 [Methylomonas sp. EFPC3]|uniref:hypothetical protein n=1 Tax=Methylomonas sp. EFPC3 TaxID=3021710 RepID=UPI00241692E7|nr:hypothetical protein [Methylomonas sp. EFPC3]WFP48504.1 hypothetical protein PL263_10305 [Methylomonas sp. EFPC3]